MCMFTDQIMTKTQQPLFYVLLVVSLLTLCMTYALYFDMISNPKTKYISQRTKYTTIFSNFAIHRTIHVINNNATNNHIAKNTDSGFKNTNHYPNHFDVTSESFKRNVDHRITIANDKNSGLTRAKSMILVSLYAEQQVGAAMNMFSLQKWAKSVSASVVEPFVQNSMLRLPIVYSRRQLATTLRFRDYFDIDIWNNMSIPMNGTPLISWEKFIEQAPGKYIIFVAVVNSLRKEERPVYIDDEITEQQYCNDTFHYFITKFSFYINLLKAKVIRRVCLSFYKTIMNIDQFTNTIYGNISSSDAIVWFQIWKGFSRPNRVRVFQQQFHRSRETLKMLHTSWRIARDSQRYIREFLKSEPGKYTAISIRTMLRGKYLPRSNHSSFFHNCIKEVGDVISSNTDGKIFVAMDLGRFGDRVVESFIHKSIIKKIEREIFLMMYNNSLSMWKWEKSFIQVTNGITDSGYIAALQRTIVENSRCLVLFGGRSNFQRTLLLNYKENHDNKTCIYEVCYQK